MKPISRISRAVVAAASLTLATPALAQKEENPKSTFLVINNTNQILHCSWRLPGFVKRSWSAWFELPPAANWRIPGGGSILMQCAPPVKRTIFTVDPGSRYSLLRAADGSVDLVRVSTGR